MHSLLPVRTCQVNRSLEHSSYLLVLLKFLIVETESTASTLVSARTLLEGYLATRFLLLEFQARDLREDMWVVDLKLRGLVS